MRVARPALKNVGGSVVLGSKGSPGLVRRFVVRAGKLVPEVLELGVVKPSLSAAERDKTESSE